MTARELKGIKHFLNIDSKEKVQKILNIFALDCPEWQKRELIGKEFQISEKADELFYLLPDGDNTNALTFAIYLDNEFSIDRHKKNPVW